MAKVDGKAWKFIASSTTDSRLEVEMGVNQRRWWTQSTIKPLLR